MELPSFVRPKEMGSDGRFHLSTNLKASTLSQDLSTGDTLRHSRIDW